MDFKADQGTLRGMSGDVFGKSGAGQGYAGGMSKDSSGRVSDVKRQLRGLFEGYGYTRYRMGKFEEYDTYAKNRNFVAGGAILTFTDTDGRLMALKPDVTMSIVKNTLPSEALHKLYYFESVYRAEDPAAGFGEIPQAGVECIGEIDLTSVCEVIALAAGSLEAMSERYILDISHMGVLSGLLEDAGVDGESREELLRFAEGKNSHEARAAAKRAGMRDEDFELFDRLIHLRSRLYRAVEELEDMRLGERAAEAVRELRAIAGVLGDRENIYLDLSLRSDARYYTGLVMKGYIPGLAKAVLSGGRYDGLVRRLHREEGAVGFAVYLGLLEDAGRDTQSVDVLVIDEKGDPEAMFEYVSGLRSQGLSVRADRAAPEGLEYKRLVRFTKEGPVNG